MVLTETDFLHGEADHQVNIHRQVHRDIATEVNALSGGSTPLFIALTKSSAVDQNVGGAASTEVWWTWDGEDHKDSEFTHSTVTNSSRITVGSTALYKVEFMGNAQQTGAARSTLQGIIRVNGGTTQRKGSIRDYSRGSSYGNLSPGLVCVISLTASQYIEVGTRVEQTDATYTISTNGAEIADDENVLIVTKLT